MIKRILRYNKDDRKHLRWLFRNMLKQFFIKADIAEAKEAWFFIKLHLAYDSKRGDE